MNASKFGRFEDEMIGLPNDISIKSRSISFPLGILSKPIQIPYSSLYMYYLVKKWIY